MKKIIAAVIMTITVSGFALEGETVIKTIQDSSSTRIIKIEENTFIPNIAGYACPVPAINVKKFIFYSAGLKHNRFRNFGVNEYALEVKDPDMRFCNLPTPVEVFGEEFVVGKIIEVQVRTLLEIIELHSGGQILKETVSTDFLGEELESIAKIRL